MAVVSEGLELERVPGRVQEEHRVLFTDLTDKAYVWFDHEIDVVFLQARRKRMELVGGQKHAEMRDRYLVAVDRVRTGNGVARPGDLVDHELMFKQIEVDPVRVRAAFR